MSSSIVLGLLQIPKIPTSICSLSSSLDQRRKQDEFTSIYTLTKGSIYGRGGKSTTNANKVPIGIPMKENGVSRKQLVVQDVMPPTSTEYNTFPNRPGTYSSVTSFLAYISEMQASCPSATVQCMTGTVNHVSVYPLRVNESYLKEENGIESQESPVLKHQILLKKGEDTELKVGDIIQFDSYKIVRGDPGKYIYQIVAYPTKHTGTRSTSTISTSILSSKKNHKSKRKSQQATIESLFGKQSSTTPKKLDSTASTIDLTESPFQRSDPSTKTSSIHDLGGEKNNNKNEPSLEDEEANDAIMLDNDNDITIEHHESKKNSASILDKRIVAQISSDSSNRDEKQISLEMNNLNDVKAKAVKSESCWDKSTHTEQKAVKNEKSRTKKRSDTRHKNIEIKSDSGHSSTTSNTGIRVTRHRTLYVPKVDDRLRVKFQVEDICVTRKRDRYYFGTVQKVKEIERNRYSLDIQYEDGSQCTESYPDDDIQMVISDNEGLPASASSTYVYAKGHDGIPVFACDTAPKEIYPGDLVSCYYQNGTHKSVGWFTGRVASVSEDGDYCDVTYHDKDYECNIPLHDGKVRLLERGTCNYDWKCWVLDAVYKLDGEGERVKVIGLSLVPGTELKGDQESNNMRDLSPYLNCTVQYQDGKVEVLPYLEVLKSILESRLSASKNVLNWPASKRPVVTRRGTKIARRQRKNPPTRGFDKSSNNRGIPSTNKTTLSGNKRNHHRVKEESTISTDHSVAVKQEQSDAPTRKKVKMDTSGSLCRPKRNCGRPLKYSGSEEGAHDDDNPENRSPKKSKYCDDLGESSSDDDYEDSSNKINTKKSQKKSPNRRSGSKSLNRIIKTENDDFIPPNIPLGFLKPDEKEHEKENDSDVDFEDSQETQDYSGEDPKREKESTLSLLSPNNANTMWTCIQSFDPQKGFGSLMYLLSTQHQVPNVNLIDKLIDFIVLGPHYSDIRYVDEFKTGCATRYLERVIDKLSEDAKGSDFPSVIDSITWVHFSKIVDKPVDVSYPTAKFLWPYLFECRCALSLLVKVLKTKSSIYENTDGVTGKLDLNRSSSGGQDHIRESMKKAIRSYIKSLVCHGRWIYDYLHPKNRSYKCKDADESQCARETEQCINKLGQVVCYVTQLYCAKESISVDSDDCCYLIRDTVVSQLENIDYTACFGPSETKVKNDLKQKISKKIQIQFIGCLSSLPNLQSHMAEMLDLQRECSIIIGNLTS